MVASFLPMTVSFIMLPVFTRYLSPQDYGIWALTQTFGIFLLLILSLQIQASIGRFYFDYKGEEQKVLVSTVSLVLLIFSSAALIILLVFLNRILAFVFPKTSASMYILFRLTLIATFFNALAENFKILLMAREKAKLFMKISLSLFFVGLIINIVEVIVLKKGIYGIIEASLIISITGFIVLIFFNFHFLVLKFNIEMFKGPIRYSLPIIPHALAGIIFMYSDRIIMEKYVLLSAIGLYSLSDKIAMI